MMTWDRAFPDRVVSGVDASVWRRFESNRGCARRVGVTCNAKCAQRYVDTSGVTAVFPAGRKVLAMSQIELTTPATLPQANGYSHVATIGPGSRLIWTSGQVPIAADGTPAPAGDWEAQTRQAMHNVGAALAAAGATWDDVFKLTFYVVDTSALPTVRAVRDDFINTERPPTSSLVRVAGLFQPDLLIEIEAVAAIADG
jgi:enamine deaminase RidA (YjgF/YER057c/UK114 family)